MSAPLRSSFEQVVDGWTLGESLTHLFDGVTSNYYFRFAVLSYLCSVLSYAVLTEYFVGREPWFKKLSPLDRADFKTRVVSSIHSTIVFALCLYALATDDKMWIDGVRAHVSFPFCDVRRLCCTAGVG